MDFYCGLASSTCKVNNTVSSYSCMCIDLYSIVMLPEMQYRSLLYFSEVIYYNLYVHI